MGNRKPPLMLMRNEVKYNSLFDTDYLSNLYSKMQMDLVHKKDKAIEAALNREGFTIEDVKREPSRFSCIWVENDGYEHYYMDYGKDTEKRIISFQRKVSFKDENNRITIESKFY